MCPARVSGFFLVHLLIMAAPGYAQGICDDVGRAVMDSLVRIDLVAINESGEVLKREEGQGVLLTDDGLILTAAHVVLPPSIEWFGVAPRYRLEIRRWLTETSNWSRILNINGPSVWESVVVHPNLSTTSCRENLRCLDGKPPLKHDFAFLRTNLQKAFTNTFGPQDRFKDVMELHPYAQIYIFSLFDRNAGAPSCARVYPKRHSGALWFETLEAHRFEKGVSGSPLVLYFEPVDSFFIAGVASRIPDDSDEGRKLKVLLLENVLSDFVKKHDDFNEIMNRLTKWLLPDDYFPCQSRRLPPKAILTNFTRLRHRLREKEATAKDLENVAKCLGHPPWASTKTHYEVRLKYAKHAGEFTGTKQLSDNLLVRRFQETFRNPSYTVFVSEVDKFELTKAADQAMEEMITDAYSGGIDPIKKIKLAAPAFERNVSGLSKDVQESIKYVRQQIPVIELLLTLYAAPKGKQLVEAEFGKQTKEVLSGLQAEFRPTRKPPGVRLSIDDLLVRLRPDVLKIADLTSIATRRYGKVVITEEVRRAIRNNKVQYLEEVRT
jgi:hypothetical protein